MRQKFAQGCLKSLQQSKIYLGRCHMHHVSRATPTFRNEKSDRCPKTLLFQGPELLGRDVLRPTGRNREGQQVQLPLVDGATFHGKTHAQVGHVQRKLAVCDTKAFALASYGISIESIDLAVVSEGNPPRKQGPAQVEFSRQDEPGEFE
jgi:hypothetical protein